MKYILRKLKDDIIDFADRAKMMLRVKRNGPLKETDRDFFDVMSDLQFNTAASRVGFLLFRAQRVVLTSFGKSALGVKYINEIQELLIRLETEVGELPEPYQRPGLPDYIID